LSIRTKWVGTHWLSVTLSVWISSSAFSGSNFSMTTTVPPRRCTVIDQRNGAA
jgi:hypothetical protein